MFNFIKKYFSVIFIIFFILIFSLFKSEDFIKNYKTHQDYQKELINIEKEIKKFDLNKIKQLQQTSFYYTPYKDLLEKIIEQINSTKEKLYIEVYMFTENYRLPNAIIKAKKRGVDVKVLLEKNPYKSPNVNNKIFNLLKSKNIDIKWSNPDNYSLNHSKIMIFDNSFFISTGNLTYSTFTKNRDLFLFSEDKNILQKLEKIFFNDFNGLKYVIYDNNLVLSPFYAKEKFEKLFLGARKNLKLYFQYLDFRDLEDVLLKKAKDGIDIKIIVSKNFFEDKQNKIKFFQRKGIKIKYLQKEKMHSKAILVDDKYLFIGSQNFSKFSLLENREIGLLLINKNIIKKFNNLFFEDWKKEK